MFGKGSGDPYKKIHFLKSEGDMFRGRILGVSLSIGLILLSITGCSFGTKVTCGSGFKAGLLESMLDARNSRSFNEALRNHGAVTFDELPCIEGSLDSWSKSRRRNAAKLLNLVGGNRDAVQAVQEKAVLETKDVFVWAEIFEFLTDPRVKEDLSNLAAKRHDMIAEALANADSFVQSVGIMAGVLGKYPGIDAELKKRLDSMDPKMLKVALDALPPETARTEVPRLLGMLKEYETGTKYKASNFKIYMIVPLLNALIRSEDPGAFLAVRNALEKGYERPGIVGGTREELTSFRNSAAAGRPDEFKKKFCYYLINEKSIVAPTAIDILTTQVWAAKQEPTPQLVQICIEAIENGNLETVYKATFKYKKEQTECQRLFHFLETGENPIGGKSKTKIGADAVEIGKRWLKDNE